MLSTNRYCYSASSLTCLGLLCMVALEVKMLVFVEAAVNHLSIVFSVTRLASTVLRHRLLD